MKLPMDKRLYVLSVTDEGVGSLEFGSEAVREKHLASLDATFDDFFCLDVDEDGDIDFYIASTGDSVS